MSPSCTVLHPVAPLRETAGANPRTSSPPRPRPGKAQGAAPRPRGAAGLRPEAALGPVSAAPRGKQSSVTVPDGHARRGPGAALPACLPRLAGARHLLPFSHCSLGTSRGQEGPGAAREPGEPRGPPPAGHGWPSDGHKAPRPTAPLPVSGETASAPIVTRTPECRDSHFAVLFNTKEH
ncbi:PREDICTED: translation initiation factor IF-2-like [Chinchilla lanigera]|uniref:translation initiation factor IF-2-like n=1 Tax=Chinchilla lanigera TaxID=34839 RepID=UPI000696B337|nr:PREDICTED: translation initiation factor IF-2-like [Chinchilla lanigera]